MEFNNYGNNFGYTNPMMPMNYNTNTGGYPYGYPPQIMTYQQQMVPPPMYSQYSPFINPQQQSYYDPETMQMISNDMPLKAGPDNPLKPYNYVPGRQTGYIEAERSDGSTDKMFIQGGVIKRNGGYNPVTQTITRATVAYPAQQSTANAPNGFSPYVQAPANLQYPANNYYPNNAYTGYMTPNYGYGYVRGYPLNDFNTYIQELVYEENPSIIDGREFLEDIILSDEEREKINHNSNMGIVGTDYYGRPIYSNYGMNKARQDYAELMRNRQIDHFTMLSRIAHAYTGEKFNEEKTRKRFDPATNMQPVMQQNKPFNFYTATPEEKKKYLEDKRIEECNMLDAYVEQWNQQMVILEQQKAIARKRIKDSHDALIGVQPGEHYSLATYLTNGYKIGVNMEMQKLKQRKRNGKLKYNSKAYREQIIQRGVQNGIIQKPQPVPSSKDEEFLTLETALKQAYDYNKANIPIPLPDHGQSLMIELGDDKPKTTVVTEENADIIGDKFFQATYAAATEKKRINDIKRGMLYG